MHWIAALILAVLAAACSAQSVPLIYPGGVPFPGPPPACVPLPGSQQGVVGGLNASWAAARPTPYFIPERIEVWLTYYPWFAGLHQLPPPPCWPEMWVYVCLADGTAQPPPTASPYGIWWLGWEWTCPVAVRLLPQDWTPGSGGIWRTLLWFGQPGISLPSGPWHVQAFVVAGSGLRAGWTTNQVTVSVP